MNLKLIPPLGTPIKLRDIFLSLDYFGKNYKDRFEEEFSNFIGTNYAFLLDSGRNAFGIILDTLKEKSDRKDVIIPAYTCPTMAYAVKRAGLNLKLCDVNLSTLSLDPDLLEGLIDHNTLCIVPTHLFGYPCGDLDKIIDIAKKQEAFVIEDASQAAGAKINQGKVGSFGDFAIFSLGKGKNFTTINGGIITTNSKEFALSIKKKLSTLVKPGLFRACRIYLELIMYSIFIRPLGFGIVRKMINPENTNYAHFSKPGMLFDFQIALGSVILKNLDKLNAVRIRNSRYINQELEGLSKHYIFIKEVKGATTVYPSFPIIIREKDRLQTIYDKLMNSGIGVARMYPFSINKIWDSSEHCPNAEFISERLLILPTGHFLKKKHITAMGKILRAEAQH